MRHIEFLGSPGAGKSTLFDRIISREEYFGSIEEKAVSRWMRQNADAKYRLPYRVSPPFVRSVVENEFIGPRLKRTAFDDFVQTFPGFLRVLAQVLEDATEKPIQLFKMLRRKAEEYQLGSSTVRPHETLCLDSGFAQRAMSILWRFDHDSFQLDTYLRRIPTPTVIVYVDAPVDVCLRRQRDRSAVTASKEWAGGDIDEVQRQLHTYCQEIRRAADRHTEVVTVENTGDIDDAVETVVSRIREVS